MPTTGILQLEWLNHNSQRRFPLTDDASGLDDSGAFRLPNDFLVELDLPIHAGMDVNPVRFLIRSVAVYATGFAITVGYQPADGDAVDVATALVPRLTSGGLPAATNTSYALGGIGDYADTVGKLTIGKLAGIDEQPSGLFMFSLDHARIEPDCVRPLIRGVSALIVVSGTERSARLYGDIELVAEENIQLTPVIVSGEDPQLRISAISGEGLTETCECEDQGEPIRSINGVRPTPAGDFTLLGSDCLQVNTVTNGLQLVDICSKPCCGCTELEAVTRELERFGTQATTLEAFLMRLESSVTQMDQVVLGSKLGDRGCARCD